MPEFELSRSSVNGMMVDISIASKPEEPWGSSILHKLLTRTL